MHSSQLNTQPDGSEELAFAVKKTLVELAEMKAIQEKAQELSDRFSGIARTPLFVKEEEDGDGENIQHPRKLA